MKFLIVGDLHGHVPKIHFKGFDAIIAPGDFCSSHKTIKYMFKALGERLKNPESKKKWYDYISKTKAKKLVLESISDGRVILEKLNSFGVPVYLVPGNHDLTPDKKAEWQLLKKNHYKGLKKGLRNLVDVHHKIKDTGEHKIIGHGLSSGPEYPQYEEDLARYTPKELLKKLKSYKKLYNRVDKLFLKAKKPIIFLTHNVPFNTKIDKIVNKDSPRDGQHMGSIIARELIDKYQPLVSIGGHMHEHFTKVKLGKTVCINSGYGSNVNILMELEGNKIKKLKFYKGKK